MTKDGQLQIDYKRIVNEDFRSITPDELRVLETFTAEVLNPPLWEIWTDARYKSKHLPDAQERRMYALKESLTLAAVTAINAVQAELRGLELPVNPLPCPVYQIAERQAVKPDNRGFISKWKSL
ncbi:hypothetical protein CMS34_22905 [Salmonella enterica]|nr:hypothetical protein [Salmonella enterica]